MDIKEFTSRIDNRDMTRRQFHGALASAGLVVVAAPLLGERAHAANTDPATMMNFTWGGYDIPELCAPYVEKYGTTPEYSLFSGISEAAEKLKAGFAADVVHPCSNYTRIWHGMGLINEIDVERLQWWGNFWPELQEIEGVRLKEQNNGVFLVPVDWGNSSVCYNTEMYPDDVEESWTMVLDPGHAGRISVNADTDNLVGVALAIGIDPYHMTDADLEKVRDAMIAQRALVRFYWDSATEIAQAFANGEIDVAVCWNETAVAMAKEGIPVKLANPKEGIITWVCGVVHSTTGESDDQLVYDFINAITSPETGVFLIEEYGYGHSNMLAFDMVPPERLAELGISDVAGLFAEGIFAVEGTPGMRDKWHKVIEEVTLGM